MNIEEWTDVSWKLSKIFDEINTEYIKKMASHINDIGQLSATDVHRLEQMLRMSENITEINRQLAVASNKTMEELAVLYEQSGLDIYASTAKFYEAKKVMQIPYKSNKSIQRYVKSIYELTGNTFENISRTTAITHNYTQIVDKAIVQVTSGEGDYRAAMRQGIKDMSMRGIPVEYASGYKRRLDSAIRMNILAGARQVNQGVRLLTAQEYGADGVEISAHGLCAPDHIHIQGKVMSNKAFKKLNASLQRPVGELNCRHVAYPIVMGVSEPAYSDKELKETNAYASEKITIGDKQITRYEATQAMRKLETEVRRSKDAIIGLREMDDTEGIAVERERIREKKALYSQIAKTAGLAERPERMAVAGFTR